MAIWDNLGSKGNVEDRRGLAPLAAGGVGIVGFAIIAGLTLLGGGNIGDVLNQLQHLDLNQIQQEDTSQFAGLDDYEIFASTVLGSADEYWNSEFNRQNKNYIPPKLVLFRQSTQSACGAATSSVGPHYCPLDRTIYLDETFFDELKALGSQGGDVAEAYVIAHEVGHHVQNILGILDRAGNSNDASIRIELQADCFAGLWANSIRDLNVLQPNEIQEALDAAAAVGDDRIQEKVTGQINPETWTHGSSRQRVEAFNRGFETGDFNRCSI